jgi:hypothetical protein
MLVTFSRITQRYNPEDPYSSCYELVTIFQITYIESVSFENVLINVILEFFHYLNVGKIVHVLEHPATQTYGLL